MMQYEAETVVVSFMITFCHVIHYDFCVAVITGTAIPALQRRQQSSAVGATVEFQSHWNNVFQVTFSINYVFTYVL